MALTSSLTHYEGPLPDNLAFLDIGHHETLSDLCTTKGHKPTNMGCECDMYELICGSAYSVFLEIKATVMYCLNHGSCGPHTRAYHHGKYSLLLRLPADPERGRARTSPDSHRVRFNMPMNPDSESRSPTRTSYREIHTCSST